MSAAAEGRPCLVAATQEWIGLLNVAGTPPNHRVTGPVFEIIKIISEKLHTCVEFVFSDDKNFGFESPNGTWTGVIGMIERGEADLSGVVLSVDAARSQVVDFSVPLFMDEQVLTYRRPVYESDLLGFIKPYTMQIWFMLLVTMGVVALVLFMTQLSNNIIQSRFGTKQKQDLEREAKQTVLGRLWNSAYLTLALLLCQSLPRMPRNNAMRVMGGLWLLSALIVSSVYRSNLKAMLILPKLRLPFDSMEELVETDIPTYVAEGTMLYHEITVAPPDSLLGRLRAQSVSNLDFSWAIQQLMMGRHASFTGRVVGQFVIHQIFEKTNSCPLYTAKETFWGATSIALAFPKGSPLKPKIDKILQRLIEFGIPEHLYREQIQHLRKCQMDDFTRPSDALRPLDLGDFYGVFTVYAGGNLLSLLVFLSEVFIGRKARRTQP
ncbi:glutamate receptor ionotropic, kainate 2-like [Penaeus japonicus]|uniref:glutamate receptor ionotropic, kainate 2-like n=1 Tax=Penaeus japonicus TaxID=27405 RepID=UPI001C70EF97|nr:glutamate receptor ionotropic, kainate 2-like [Penaeus japonicus]XP_042855747.1 glutamate receptor ionotropic, kainate 2-like [Penaeus japonicus]